MSTIETAIKLAVEAHAGQRDKAGRPYILHPLRVMHRFTDETLQIIAVLHDVLEDTAITADDLQHLGFEQDIIQALQCLSKREGESYDDFITRVLADPLARQVKQADLLDNMDCTRLDAFTSKDAERMARYTAALVRIRAANPT